MVLVEAADGRLPPFALHMGLSGADWDSMYRDSVGAEPVVAPPSGPIPPVVPQLVALMMEQRSAGADVRQANWLAHAIACASFGSRHLWQDLGLAGRAEVSALLQHYFEPLFVRNTRNLKWKRFLYETLALTSGSGELRPPGCAACEDFAGCYRQLSATR